METTSQRNYRLRNRDKINEKKRTYYLENPDVKARSDRAYYLKKKAEMDRNRDALVVMLGAECAQCGSTSELQFDHIERDTKAFNLSGWPLVRKSWDELVMEALKYQLLCPTCHGVKSQDERRG